jgi:hypothetical protein
MDRSHSDAAIRIPTHSFRPSSDIIPEGIPIDENFVGTPNETDLDNQLKELATNIAESDPDYQESSLNPFASHDRYRSIRKIKPGDRFYIQRGGGRVSPQKVVDSNSNSARVDAFKSELMQKRFVVANKILE